MPGMLHFGFSDEAFVRAMWGVISSKWVNITNSCMGVMVRTETAKTFLLVRNFYDPVAANRAMIKCFDEGMNVLDGSSAPDAASEDTPFYWSADWGGHYWLADDYAGNILFTVTARTKYIFIGARGKFCSLLLYADAEAMTFSPFDAIDAPHIGASYPKVGTHLIGSRIGNESPASGQPKGWLCTVPGTMDTIGTTCTADGSAVVVVANATGLDVGQFISVNSGAALQIVAINGTSITMSGTVATGGGLSFVNSASTWVSEGNL